METAKNRIVALLQSKQLIYYTLSLAVIPVAAWILAISTKGYDASFTSLAKVHAEVPVLWLINFLPIVFAVLSVGFLKAYKRKVEELEGEVTVKSQIINKNAFFAKQIGEGNFKVDISCQDGDVLAKSLLVMRDNLLKNSTKEAEEAWIAEGKEIISNILRIHNKLDELSYEVLVSLIKYTKVVQGAFYFYDDERNLIVNLASYAYNRRKYITQEFKIGQGLIGQCAYERDLIYRTEVPGDYVSITSGILGDQKPKSIIMIPLISDERLYGILEFASVSEIEVNPKS